MKKIRIILVVLLAFVALACTNGVASAYLSIEYVGNTMVDLSWHEYDSTDFSKYELCRDGVPIATITNRSTTFYRDTGLTKGVNYDYEIRVYTTSGGLVPVETRTTSATTGEVHGTITLDTTWTAASSPYDLTEYVGVRNGSTLKIESGVMVTTVLYTYGSSITVLYTYGSSITVREKGALYADGVSFYDVNVYIDGHAEIKNCFFEDASIIVWNSNNHTITGNTVLNNSEDHGIYLDSSSNNVITDNTASNNYYAGIFLINSSNNIIIGNIASHNGNDSITLCDSSDNNVITGNTASNNKYNGIRLINSSDNNVITGNTASNNNDTGILMLDSSNNTIYNNYFNNTKNAYDNGNNTWNIPKTAGSNIVGGPYLGGNYWSDYNGTDSDGDKLGDTLIPYNCSGGIQNGGDYHPLIEIKIRGYKFNDTNGDGVWDRVNESALANWTIRLEGTTEDGSTVSLTTTTDDNGYYRFADVPKGTYTLSELLEDGWIQTWPLAPGTCIVHITNGCVEDKNFGNRRFWVSGHKFNDTNGDGVWDRVNESALANWTIRLEGTTEDGSTVSLTTTTDGNGSYRFEDVPKGTYTLSEILKIGWIQTCPPAPGTYIIIITDDDVKDKNFGNRRFHYDGNIIVGAPYEDVRGSKDQGRVYRFYGLTGELRHTIDCPSNHSNALFGYSVSSGMVGSDYHEEIIVGAPGEGRVYTFYGATSKLHHTLDCPSSQPGALFGNSVSTGDLNGDGFDEIIVGAPGEGRVYTFYGLTGELHHTIDCPSPQPDALFGNSVGAGDLNGDGFDEIIVGAPGEDVGGDESQGRVYTFYGATSKLHHTIDCPSPQPDALFGHSVNTDDLVSDYREEVIVGAPGEDVGGNKDQGRGYAFYGATSKLHVPLNCSSSQPDALFGHSLSAGDMSGDDLNEVIVGAPGEGRVYTFYGLTGKLRHTIDCPNPQPDASFGYSVSAGTVGSDYRDEVIVGAPGEDIGGNESQGRVYTFYGATSKLRHTLDTPNPQPDALFGYSVSVIGGFMGVTCSDSSVNIDHTQTSVTDDPVGEGYDVSNAPAGVNLAYAKGFNIVAT